MPFTLTTTTWVIIALIILALALVLTLVIGLKRRKSKEISFQKKEELEQAKPTSGDYQATGGFNFASGAHTDSKEKEPVLLDKTIQDTPKPLAGDTPAVETPLPTTKVEESQKETDPQDPVQNDNPTQSTSLEEDHSEEEQSAELVEEALPAHDTHVESDHTAAEDHAELKEEKKVEEKQEEFVSFEDVEPAEPEALSEPEPKPDIDSEKQAPEESAPEKPAPVEEKEENKEDIAPVEGRLARLRGQMSKSQGVIGRSVLGILGAGDLDEDAWEEIEDTLLMADLGTKTTLAIVEDLRERIASSSISTEEEARALLRTTLIEHCRPDYDRSIKAMPYEGKPAVIMVVGVNGTGKTTTTGKLSRVLVGMGHSVVLGAADTFRAAAADQLETWGRRVGAQTVRGHEGADPASVAFDAVSHGIEEGTDVVLIDTAGRLHTSVGLMDQLGKVKRVVEKKAVVDEVLLVLDATVGQNGLMQARTFRDVVDISGVVLTKLDGTAKGGIVFQVQEELGVPVKLVGLGEGADDLAPFEVEAFVDALLG